MRDIIVLAIILGSLPFCFSRPYFGILMWHWIAMMNPHRLGWGAAVNFPVAMLVGATTLLGFLVMKGRSSLPKSMEFYLLMALCALFTVTTSFAMYPQMAWQTWQEVMKIILMAIITVWLTDSKQRLYYLLVVVTLSLGFFALKGVPWGMATGGQFRLYGPTGSFVASNNAMGMALNMVIPLMLFLARNATDKKIRIFFYVTFFASFMAVILTYSRGALLGLIAVLFLLMLRSRRKFLALAFLFVGILIGQAYIPEKWFERMHTIETYEEDQSAQQRIGTWEFGWNLALERPLTGGGFNAYEGNPLGFYAHSVYFGILAEHGFIALGLFLLLAISCCWSLEMLKIKFAKIPPLAWYADCAGMLQVGIVAYLVNGLTLGKQYFDLFYLFVGLVIILKNLIRKELVAIVEKGISAPTVAVSQQPAMS